MRKLFSFKKKPKVEKGSTASLDAVFAASQERGRVAFIPYITAGYPTKSDTVPLLLAMQAGGADVIELGMPFSDPLADGPTIQRASFVALQSGVTMDDVFGFVVEARGLGLTVPVVLMGYYNPFLAYGEAKVVQAAADAGISGFIVVDLPSDEAKKFCEACSKHSVSFIPLIAPTSTDKRMEQLAAVASGYLYCVSVTGVTGSRSELSSDLGPYMERVKKFFPSVPLAIGFGLSTHEHMKTVDKIAQGAVMGSAVIKAVDLGTDTASRVEKLTAFCNGVVFGPDGPPAAAH